MGCVPSKTWARHEVQYVAPSDANQRAALQCLRDDNDDSHESHESHDIYGSDESDVFVYTPPPLPVTPARRIGVLRGLARRVTRRSV